MSRFIFSSKRGRKNPFLNKHYQLGLETLEDRAMPSTTSISGFVYHDANHNGLYDTGETPIANSSIELRNANNAVVGTTTTDANGYYLFTMDQSTAPTEKTLTKVVEFPTTQTNFSLDGMLDQFDPSLGTLTSVEIKHEATITSEIKVENYSADSASDISGTVSGNLTLVAPGVNNKVDISGYAGSAHVASYDGTTDFQGNSGTSFGQKTASGASTLTLDGSDINAYIGTGQVKVTETAIATSHADGGGNLDTQIRSTASGKVTIIYHYTAYEPLQPGNYKVIQTKEPDGYSDGLESRGGTVIPNTIGTDEIAVTLTNNASQNNNFGELKDATISGHVYHDANNDGVRQNTEAPIAGVTVTLTGANGTVNTTTDANGYYEFTSLPAGTYQLNETQPANYLDGQDSAGTLGGTVSNDQIKDITLAVGDSSQNNDFGELKPASISGRVYVDGNKNGKYDNGEAPIPNTTVTLTGFDDQGPVNLEMVTDQAGKYSFTNLRPGTYAVTETQPAGFDDYQDTVGSVGGTLGNDVVSDIALVSGDAGTDYNFGEIKSTPTTPDNPVPKADQPFVLQLPIVSKSQLLDDRTSRYLPADLRASMAFVVGANLTLTNSVPNADATINVVNQLNAGLSRADYISQLWNTDAHLASEASSLYQSVLDRNPTSQELTTAIQALRTGTSQMALAEGLYVSTEYQQLHPTSQLLAEGLYKDITNKIPGSTTTENLLQSMDNQPLSDVVHTLVTSDDSLTNFIDNTYRAVLRRPATTSEIQTWLNPLKTNAITLDELGQRLYASEEFYQLAFNSVK